MTKNKGKDILIGLAVVVVIILIIAFLARRYQQTAIAPTISPLPTPVSQFEQQLQNNFGITVPDNAVKADLKDVSGGNQMGLVTVIPQNGKFEYTILANLEDPQSGYFYEGWLVRGKQGDTNYDVISLGVLNQAKGGWLTNFDTSKDLGDHKFVWVTLQRYNNNIPATHILEGSF